MDDEERMRQLLAIMLSRSGHAVDQAGDGLRALEMIESVPYDMVVTDIKMPRMDGMTLLRKINSMQIPCPVVVITAFATVDSAVEAMRSGAADYITKPFDQDRILLAVERTLNISRIMVENRDLRLELQKVAGPDELVYVSSAMENIVRLAFRVAETESVVLISGESGTGKELLARLIHRASKRKTGRFVPVNCAAISPNLVESELFGHEKGSFTGADKRAVGRFEYAAGGTLFLDEIGDLPLEAQAKLLRALQERKIQRVGGNDEIPVDVRTICATNQDLQKMVEEGRFRRDLFFRINVVPLSLPPLRERKDDVSPLALHFLRRIYGGLEARLTEGAKRVLFDYNWPGNVRELANAMERASILTRERGNITSESLSFLREGDNFSERPGRFSLPPGGLNIEELELDLVRQAVEASGNNQMNAARLLGLSRAKFRVLMKRLKKKASSKRNFGGEGLVGSA